MRILMHVTQNYSFEILRPIQAEALARGYQVRWFVAPGLRGRLAEDELGLRTLADIMAWQADVVFVPGNEVPPIFPGLKVQVFHGFGIEKKGHFRIRGMFHLYCTHGPLTTAPFNDLAAKYRNFLVRETGWPKVDPLYQGEAASPIESRFNVLYAPTFSPALTSAEALLEPVRKILGAEDWQWRVKFHPKMDAKLARGWQSMVADNYQVVDGDILPWLHWADVMVTDTSSVAAEFMLLDKPVVTYKNRKPGPHLLNFQDSQLLYRQLQLLAGGAVPNSQARREYARGMHPYEDGGSAGRVLDAVLEVLEGQQLATLKRLPAKRLRQRKMLKSLGLR